MIPFIDLGAQYERIKGEMEETVLRVLRSGQYIMGPEVEELERSLAQYVDVRHCVSCASGTDALVIALMAKRVGPGDAILTTPFTFMASAEAISLVGATPIFVDVDPRTFNICPVRLREVVSGFTSSPPTDSTGETLTLRGIVAVDLFGLPADYSAIQDVAEANDLFVIEDAAQSFGAQLGNRRACSLASVGATSFFPAKPLGCYGDGGALFTDDDALAELFRSIRVHGQGVDRYEHDHIGLTGRLDALQAAILSVKFKVFPDEMEARQRIAKSYGAAIQRVGLPLDTPKIPSGYASAWAQYSVLAADSEARTAFQSALSREGIPTGIYYPKPLHLQQAFSSLGYVRGDFPIAEQLSERIFSLPMHPYLDDQTIEAIIGAMET